METVLFYASLSGTAAFAVTFIILALRRAAAKPAAGAGGPAVEGHGGIPTTKQVADLAEAFEKSGPRATAASLTVLFFTAALITGGVVEVSLDAGSDPSPAEPAQSQP